MLFLTILRFRAKLFSQPDFLRLSDATPYLNRRMSSDSFEEAFSDEVAVLINEKLTKVGLRAALRPRTDSAG